MTTNDPLDLRGQFAEHLRFMSELGVEGVSRDSRWRTRPGQDGDGSRDSTASTRTAIMATGKTRVGETMGDVPVLRVARSAFEALVATREDLGDCTRCKLHALGRRQIVFGTGNPEADLMFVGEAPGHDEDVQGVPFVGRAGQKLTQIIEAIGLTREQVYIANVIKCRPPQNRNPEPDEVASCQPFLFRQISAIGPKVIVALGTFAARALLQSEESISRLRGRVYEYRGARLIATFHPAYLLRNPGCRRDVWEDMQKVRDLLQPEVAS
jgi:uracil-DNA glycosylase